MNDRTEYYRQQKAKQRAKSKGVDNSVDITVPSVDIVDTSITSVDTAPHKRTITHDRPLPDISIFNGKGRGVVVDGHVLVAGNATVADRIVTQDAWQARLNTHCQHDLAGWSCKVC